MKRGESGKDRAWRGPRGELLLELEKIALLRALEEAGMFFKEDQGSKFLRNAFFGEGENVLFFLQSCRCVSSGFSYGASALCSCRGLGRNDGARREGAGPRRGRDAKKAGLSGAVRASR